MPDQYFCDIHFHTLTLAHPNLIAFIANATKSSNRDFISRIFSSNYLLSGLMKSPGKRIRNMLTVMENDVAGMFRIMEDDLQGKYSNGNQEPFIKDGELHFAGRTYQKIILTPLIIDFGNKQNFQKDIYYSSPPSKPVFDQIIDVLSGIREYRKERPEGIFEIYPFLGINPANYEPEELEKLLKRFFGSYSGNHFRYIEKFNRMDLFNGYLGSIGNHVFSGIKLYPPQGFDPWPESIKEREKAELLYEFCSRKKIPITTHCDDQGFRSISLIRNWRYSAPHRWEKVLQIYPELKINFAHFGKQYYRKAGSIRQWDWFSQILELMSKYPNIYADLSFNGCEITYYRELNRKLNQINTIEERNQIKNRIMFGSDFMVNLIKIDSYSGYYRFFENSGLSMEDLHRFVSINPQNFLFQTSIIYENIVRTIKKFGNMKF